MTQHDASCAEWCNHCQVCGVGIMYGSRCRYHYQGLPSVWTRDVLPAWVEWMTRGDGGESGLPVDGDDPERLAVRSRVREEPAQAGGPE